MLSRLTALVPMPYRLAGIALLSAALFAFGWLKGAGHVQGEFDRYLADEKAAVAAQEARTKAISATQKTITTASEAHHAATTTALRDLYGPGRLQPPAAGGGLLSRFPAASLRVDAPAADTGPGSDGPASRPDDYPRLRSDAALTTVQLLELQAWILDQCEAMRGPGHCSR